ncbi:magnesium transporter [Clostridium sp. D2Q-11]|uniref:Magnesium transporter MgtE n=1 Tax=Anaeromonas frigoriresistens TaxID=2683708 RepID=A0A942UU51_9FIRM|nr:magnesium transporter [Anaeromonas frigoriresistens]MBS4536824.1 magnesium transporter [Anaeromonas frigoriresistens]
MEFISYHENLLKYLLYISKEDLEIAISHIHPEDILDALRLYEGDKKDILSKLPKDILVDVVDQAEDEEKYELLSIVSEARQKHIIDEMSSDELTDLLGSLSNEEANKIIYKMNIDDAKEIRELLSYEEDTAGGIMATEFIAIKEDMSIANTLKYLQKEAPNAETAYYLYVLNHNSKLRGVVSLRDLVINDFNVEIKDIMNENVISIPWDMDQEEVGNIFEKYGLLTMPVIDNSNRMLGIITADDIFEIIREEDTEDIYRLAGLDEDEKIERNIRESVKNRLPWLFVNLFTAILASITVSFFEGTIQRIVALATFMPIVAGMGGNAGTQTLTLIVRSIALGELTIDNTKKVLLKELGIGIFNGIAIGLSIGILSFLWEKNIIFGVVIGVAMILNMLIAAISGFGIPIILKKLNIDPALASAVFVTTMTDVLGFFFFLGLATLLIDFL